VTRIAETAKASTASRGIGGVQQIQPDEVSGMAITI